MIQYTVDQFLDKVTLRDLISSEQTSSKFLYDLLAQGQGTGEPAV
jgi:hypothetical protein